MTPIDIANIAIEALGQRPISSFDEGSVAANCARATLRAAIEVVLERSHWNDATSRVLLSAEATAPAFGFTYQYLLPADVLRVRDIGCSDLWRREGRRLLTNASGPLRVEYTRNLILDERGKPISPGAEIPIGGMLASAMAFWWASLIAKKFNGSMQDAAEMERRYNVAYLQALAADAAEGTIPQPAVGSWVNQHEPDPWAG